MAVEELQRQVSVAAGAHRPRTRPKRHLAQEAVVVVCPLHMTSSSHDFINHARIATIGRSSSSIGSRAVRLPTAKVVLHLRIKLFSCLCLGPARATRLSLLLLARCLSSIGRRLALRSLLRLLLRCMLRFPTRVTSEQRREDHQDCTYTTRSESGLGAFGGGTLFAPMMTSI